jgi:hypothetical protein
MNTIIGIIATLLIRLLNRFLSNISKNLKDLFKKNLIRYIGFKIYKSVDIYINTYLILVYI